MDFLYIDMETFWDTNYTLRKLTTQQYIDDERFEVIGVAVAKNYEPPVWFTGTMQEIGNWLQSFDWEHSYAVAHNAMFDMSILSWKFRIRPHTILDTLSMGRAIHGVEAGGSLAALAERYGLKEKGKDVEDVKGLRRVDFTKQQLDTYGEYCKNDVAIMRDLLDIFHKKMNGTEIALIDMTIKMHTLPQFTLDYYVLEDNLRDIRNKKQELMDGVICDKADLMSNDKLANLLRECGVKPPMKTSARTGKETYAFAKSDEAFKELLDHEDETVAALVAARLGVKSTIEETRTERFMAIWDENGMLPVPLKYYGAITGRWAATGKINLQNLPRGSKLKKAVRAIDNQQIVGADLSNIELRVGLYFAGQMDKLKMLGEGLDLYKDFAASAFKVKYDEVTDEQRFVGKTAQLSLIYGTGHAKLRAQIKMLSGNDIGEKLAKQIVNLYREEYADVKAAWADAGKALTAIEQKSDATIGLGKLQLTVKGKSGIELPSGLYMTYPDLSSSDDNDGRTQWAYKTRRGETSIHPAKCFQNIIQALARCVMGEAMVKVNKKYPVGLTIHDALYCAVPTEHVMDAMAFIVEKMRKAPKWMPGIPLDAECGFGDNLSFKMKPLEKWYEENPSGLVIQRY